MNAANNSRPVVFRSRKPKFNDDVDFETFKVNAELERIVAKIRRPIVKAVVRYVHVTNNYPYYRTEKEFTVFNSSGMVNAKFRKYVQLQIDELKYQLGYNGTYNIDFVQE